MRLEISELSLSNEATIANELLECVEPLETLEPEIFEHAIKLVKNMRDEGGGRGVEAFLHEYQLETQEGIALMCLAEALLRIPDAETANQLIRGTFSETEWSSHLGESQSLFVNASSWGLLLTGKVVKLQGSNPFGILGNAVGRVGEPVIRESLKTAMRLIGRQFVLGENTDEALNAAERFTKKGYLLSFDILGEGARTDQQAESYAESYVHAIEAIGKQAGGSQKNTFSLSVKLSALHPRFILVKREQLFAELLPRLTNILLKAKSAGLSVSIDAEEAARLDITLEVLSELLKDPSFRNWNGLGFVVQAYQKRASKVIDFLASQARETGRVIPIRLVKGAYWDSEIKWAQMAGLPDYPVFTRKENTDVSYMACVVKLLDNIDVFYPQFATHNARTAASVIVLAKKYGISPDAFEFQRLYGMGELLHDQLLKDFRCRIYAPVGEHQDLLAYLIRRLMENSANTSFVHLILDENIPVETLLANPIAGVKEKGGNAHSAITLPRDIYNGRWQNSRGDDVAYLAMHDSLRRQLDEFSKIQWRATPLVAEKLPKNLKTRPIVSPANFSDVVGEVTEASKEMVNPCMLVAKAAHKSWDELGIEKRALIIENIAHLFEMHRVEIMALLMREAGKTWADAMAEVREAEDFCRYYAYQGRKHFSPDVRPSYTGESNVLSLHGRGVFVCISPWNFPFAIFTGQVVAALVTGNSVLTKPAEQTPLVAHKAVELMLEAGVPKEVLQLLPGDGAEIGAALIEHPAASGVVFTGSDATAKIIHLNIGKRSGPIIPLIAETGGINCMVVDSSALLEQACDDIVTSAFGSAGQRCSALRLLYVQEDIADDLLELVKGAMDKLTLGNTWNFVVDIGPVIDTEAKDKLNAHIEALHKNARFIAHAPLTDTMRAQGHFVAPHAFEITSDTDLSQEFFGPILHVVRFKQQELKELPARINAKNYGLTFGIHSRIHDHIMYFCQEMNVGNVYVNRSMIGAIVGVQPFGGEGLSGTGPKAGGPHYLLRFVHEQHISNNVVAIGGNIALLSQ